MVGLFFFVPKAAYLASAITGESMDPVRHFWYIYNDQTVVKSVHCTVQYSTVVPAPMYPGGSRCYIRPDIQAPIPYVQERIYHTKDIIQTGQEKACADDLEWDVLAEQ